MTSLSLKVGSPNPKSESRQHITGAVMGHAPCVDLTHSHLPLEQPLFEQEVAVKIDVSRKSWCTTMSSNADRVEMFAPGWICFVFPLRDYFLARHSNSIPARGRLGDPPLLQSLIASLTGTGPMKLKGAFL
jgi:hypothetical protein